MGPARARDVVSPAGALKRTAYGAIFVVGVPATLLVWARLSAPLIHLPAVGRPDIGWGLVTVGVALVVAGMVGLMVHGHGLPMNAFPPPRFAREGVFRWMRDPIYVGFGLVVLGVSLAFRSPSGLWLVTPVTWLAMAALVAGYERHDLRRRFGDGAAAPTALSLPRPGPESPTSRERISTIVLVLGSWLAAYYAVQGLGRPPDAFSTLLPGETRWPVLPWMELPYVSAYILVPLAAVTVRSRDALRAFALSGITATVVITLCWVAVPVVAVHRPFTPHDWMGALLAAEQSHSNDVAAFPSFHVLWPMLAARAWGMRRRAVSRWLAWAWVALVALSCVGTGHHSVVDVVAGAAVYLPLRDVGRTWAVVRNAGERLANSWREWRLGRVRFINHGLYAGAAAGVGVVIAGSAAGPGMAPAVAWVGMWVLIGAATYAQILEGSSRLLRPFGWYGGLIGGVVGVSTSPLVGGRVLTLLAAFALAAPWIQSIGRLRCLVQGCCHGCVAPPGVGIRYRHPRSRVTHLANLGGRPVHPTPMYSIAGNLVIAVLLVRLRTLAAPDSLIVGVYFMLSACARFVEESYRGEPQTPVVGGLRIYQWLAVGTLVAGICLTCFAGSPVPPPFAVPSRGLLALGAIFFLIFATAMGLDLPGSNRRFSRLAAGE
jgi:protein-S-isoprenylcysteine O-methyltransferase Ste14